MCGSSVSLFKICRSISMARCIRECVCMGAEGVWIGRLNLPRAFALGTGFDLAFLTRLSCKIGRDARVACVNLNTKGEMKYRKNDRKCFTVH